jgi:hypothetical protein
MQQTIDRRLQRLQPVIRKNNLDPMERIAAETRAASQYSPDDDHDF